LVGGDARAIDAHDRAVGRALDWFERNVAETRMKDPETGRMMRTGGQKTVIATFRHDASRNLDPALHTHSVIANMVRGEDGKWRTMANERLYASKMLLGALYRNELAGELARLGYGIEKTHADGRFEIAGVSREVIEAYSTRRAEIEAAVAERGANGTAENQRLAQRAALYTRAAKRDVDRAALRESWLGQAAALGFDAPGLVAEARSRSAVMDAGRESGREEAGGHAAVEAAGDGGAPAAAPVRDDRPAMPPETPAARAASWAVAHLSEREAVFSRTDLLAAALAFSPGAAPAGEIEREVAALEKAGTLHAARLPGTDGLLTTDRALADERETIALMEAGQGRGAVPMRGRTVDKALRNGPLTEGQKEAVKLILSADDRTVGVQGYAGSGKTTMLRRARALMERKGYEVRGLAPSASAARTLEAEAGIGSETLQRFLMRYAGVAEGRMTARGAKDMRAGFRKTALVVDEGSLASTVQARDLLRIADALRIPRVVLVGDAKQLDAVDAGKPFAQLQAAGMKTAVMDEIMRQRDPDLKQAVEASLAGEIGRAFEKLGPNVAEVKPDNLPGAAAARWLALSPDERANTGLMAPSHTLRERINEIVRERLVRDGAVHGPAMNAERLVSRGYTNAEKTLAANYAPGDVVAFHRPYKRLGVDKGDELRVLGVDRRAQTVKLQGNGGREIAWDPNRLAARTGGVEVYRAEEVELRAGDRIRWTRNDMGLGLVNSGIAEVAAVRDGRVTFRLEDGRMLDLRPGDPQLRHVDRAWASTVHAFQGRTVDNVIAAMEANHAKLTTQKSFYVEISRARDRAELVTDDREALRETLEAVTGERITALEAVGAEKGKGRESAAVADRSARQENGGTQARQRDRTSGVGTEKVRTPKSADRDLGL
ncbi:MAG: relaxase domain-containing protein, partial [Defluviicoccus sp.]|nr:relaxase domain-containing protein [Defluviicoccus sp.]